MPGKLAKPKLGIVIPAYNEESVIGEVVEAIPKSILGIDGVKVLVVNDGSGDETAEMAELAGAVVLNHKINMGTGAATVTGLEYARRHNFDYVITLDGDGQHDPFDINAVIDPIIRGQADIVVGTRMMDLSGMPAVKVFGNRVMNLITFLFSGIWTTDSQSGFRAYNRLALELMKIKTSGYEICSEIFAEIKRNDLRFTEVPIRVIYTDYSKMRGQSIANGVNILIKLLTRNLS